MKLLLVNGIAPEHETILNCLRLLTRLIPFAFETGSTLNDEFFWKIPEIKKEQEEAEGDTTKVEDTEQATINPTQQVLDNVLYMQL